jgi:hypothetical protein
MPEIRAAEASNDGAEAVGIKFAHFFYRLKPNTQEHGLEGEHTWDIVEVNCLHLPQWIDSWY